MGFFCSNPRCSKKNKPFATFRGLQKHTTQSALCLNFVCRAQFQQHCVNDLTQYYARSQIINNIREESSIAFVEHHDANSDDIMNTDVDLSADTCDISTINTTNMFQDQNIFTHDYKWTIKLLKILDDINAPNSAFKDIMKWAQDAHMNGFSFIPPAGDSRKQNIAHFRKLCTNSQQLQPQILPVNIPHGRPSHVVACRSFS